jgi:putative ABC transport system permease protein
MINVLYMAWRYLAHNWIKTLILVASLTLIVYLPVGLRVLVRQSAEQLTARADVTPIIIGAKGSPLELVLNSLYFGSDMPGTIKHEEVTRVSETGLADAIPLYTRFKTRTYPIVGTTVDYLDFRALPVAAGRKMAVLGECVIGSAVAKREGLGVGSHLLSSPESVFDLAGVYPLKMKVVGVLAPSDMPDDHAAFVDVKTAWIIEGLAHGHQDLSEPGAVSGVLKREGHVVVANASVVQYNEITAENMASFHFHGDVADFPLTAVIAVPHDAKSSTILQGRYLGEEETVQIVNPRGVMDELLGTVLTVQNYVIAAVFVIGLSTLATAALVFLLSLRLRSREIQTLHKIGGARGTVFAILASEVVVVLLVGCTLAAGLTLLTSRFGGEAIRSFVL